MRAILIPTLLLALAGCHAADDAASADASHGDGHAAHAAPTAAPATDADPTAHGDSGHDGHVGLMAHDPWTRPLAPGATVAAGYGVLMNHTTAPDVLVAARADGVGRVEIHSMEEVDGVMRMRPVVDGLPLAVDGIAQLQPGGNHLMFFDVTRSWAEGERVPVTLVFRSGQELVVEFAVRQGAAAEGEHQH